MSGSTIGVEAMLVDVEVDLSAQLPAISTVGLAQSEVKESKDRVRAAIRNCGFDFPARKITVNLAPADVPKNGTAFDLPIAAAILAAAGIADRRTIEKWVLLGELALDGALRPVSGVLPIAVAARGAGRGLIVPEPNGTEAAAVEGLEVRTARSLGEVIAFLNDEHDLGTRTIDLAAALDARSGEHDLGFVRGHALARRALEVCAAGGHNLLLCGPPGTGKTLLARCLPSILPPMTPAEALEVTAIHSVAGLLPDGGLVTTRPFRSPHPSGRPAALIGGGRPLVPGEASLAHRGVLFLDEFPELDRDVLEALRGPLEDREIHLARAGRRIRFPASFMLVAAMNPCACGGARCACLQSAIDRYRGRISGPLLDRIDLHATLEPLRGEEFETAPPETSSAVRVRVLAARAVARDRCGRDGLPPSVASNAEIPRERVEAHAQLAPSARKLLATAVDEGLSGRARERALRVARTLADLGGSTQVRDEHLEEAFAYRPAAEAG